MLSLRGWSRQPAAPQKPLISLACLCRTRCRSTLTVSRGRGGVDTALPCVEQGATAAVGTILPETAVAVWMEDALSSCLDGESGGAGAWGWPEGVESEFPAGRQQPVPAERVRPAAVRWCSTGPLAGGSLPRPSPRAPAGLGLGRRRFGLACGRRARGRVCLVRRCVHTRHQEVLTKCLLNEGPMAFSL